MGLLDRIIKKNPSADDLAVSEADMGAGDPVVDDTPKMGAYSGETTAYFMRLFPGRENFVLHENIPGIVSVGVHVLEPTEDAPYYVVFTTGMSDLPMTLPAGHDDREDLKHAELYMFLPEDWNPDDIEESSDPSGDGVWPVGMLRSIALSPHNNGTFLGNGSVIPNGEDYEPLCEGTTMSGVVLSELKGDMGGFMTEDGTRINFYMVIPAYAEELNYKIKNGMDALNRRFDKGRLPMVTDLGRPNYCWDFSGNE